MGRVEKLPEQSSRGDGASSTGSPTFYPRLESLRGIACLIVAICHCFLTFRLPQAFGRNLQEIGVQWFSGTGAVILFFVLSGYVLELALRRDEASFFRKSAKFWLRRVLRIYPAALCVTCMAAVYLWWFHVPIEMEPTDIWYREWYNEPFTRGDFASSALLRSTEANHVMWTLQVELLAAAVFPLLHWFDRRISDFGRLMVLGVLIGLPFLNSCPLLLRYLYMFYLGMVCAGVRPTNYPLLWQKLVFNVVVVLAVIGWVQATSGKLATVYSSECVALVQALCSAVVIVAVTLTAASRKTWLDAKALRFLGRISYSFYLVHFLCLYLITRPLLTHIPWLRNHPVVAFAVLLVLSITAAAILGWVIYCAVEQPMIRLGKRLMANDALDQQG